MLKAGEDGLVDAAEGEEITNVSAFEDDDFEPTFYINEVYRPHRLATGNFLFGFFPDDAALDCGEAIDRSSAAYADEDFRH